MNLIQYVRDEKGQPRGVLVAFPNPAEHRFNISWSHCYKGKDRFRKEIALAQAELRARIPRYPGTMPNDIRERLVSFVTRCNKFYKELVLGDICGLSTWEVRGQTIHQRGKEIQAITEAIQARRG